MWGFLTGIGAAAVLSVLTLWVLEAGTITIVERSDDLSTVIESVWSEGSGWFREPEDRQQ
jgi:hypothetical protein